MGFGRAVSEKSWCLGLQNVVVAINQTSYYFLFLIKHPLPLSGTWDQLFLTLVNAMAAQKKKTPVQPL